MRSFLRILCACFAVALVAAACGSATETTTAADAATETASSESADAAAEGEDDASHDHGEDGHDHGDQNVIEVGDASPVPAIGLEASETDTPGVYDLAIELTNFTITPENIDEDPIDNEGHLHLLIDGQRVDRLTEVTHQLTVPDGEHLVEVELNANNHAAYAIDGEPIRAGVTLSGASADAPTASDADVTISANFAEGVVTLDGDSRVEAALGDTIVIEVESDVEDEVHLHGFDIFADVTPDEPGVIVFTPNAPGRFEIEMEGSHAFIAELVVS